MSENHDHAAHQHAAHDRQAPQGEQAWDERYQANPEI